MNSHSPFNTLRHLTLIPLVAFGVLSIIASGGGGGGGGGGSGESPATITTTNAAELVGEAMGTSDATAGLTAASTQQSITSGQSLSSARKLAQRLKTIYQATVSKAQVTHERAAPAESFEETLTCDFGQGTEHDVYNINNDGTGTLDSTYNNCLINGLTYNGKTTLRVTAFDLTFFIPTDLTFTASLTITGSGVNLTLGGSLRDQLNIAGNTETITFNDVTTDNIAGKTIKTHNLVFVFVDSTVDSSYTLSITGRLWDSDYGYVDVSQATLFHFATSGQLFPDSGQLILFGASNASIRATALSATLLTIELDLDGDSAYELTAYLRWIDLGGPIGADLGDEDGDAMHNSWETFYGLDPTNPADAVVDSDGDGFINFDEYSDGTNPKNAASIPPSADVSISKTGPTSAVVGQSFAYTLTVINSGPATAFGVAVTDALPAGLDLVSVTSSQGVCSGSSTLTCDLGTVAAGSSATINLLVTASTEGTYSNTASVTSDIPDPNLANNSATGAMTVVTSPVADVSISKTGTTSTLAGENFAYTITVVNVGTATALGVAVTDALPAGLNLLSVTSSQGSCTGSSTVTCDLGTVAVGSNAIINLSVTASTAGTYINTASVTSDSPDGNSANNSAMMTTFVGMSSSGIQAQIDAATDGDTVVVAPGTYVGSINFHGKAITVKSEQGPDVTIIDGNGAASVVTFNSGEGNASVLDGFTLQNGFASEGGGISIQSSSPTITNNIITNNTACEGAGIGLSFASAIIQGNVVRNNTKGGCSGGFGGGGLSIRGASSAQILDNEISNNSSTEGGGISLFAAGTPTIRNNIISGNTGGAIEMANTSDALIVQNVIADNSASTCGGISWLVPSGARGPLLVNNTIVNNDGTQGSAICADGFDAQTEMVNNIIVAKAGQTAVYCGNFNDLNPPIFRFNDVFSPSGAAYGGICTDQTGINGNISENASFVDASNGDYRIGTGSPVIDAGDNTVSDLPTMDLAGNNRVLDGNGDSSAVVDMGAYEFAP